MNLLKYISACGEASRRGAEKLVRSGAVRVNDRIIDEPAYQVDEKNDIVCVNGIQCVLPEKNYYVLLHKPRGFVCSNSDKHADALAVDLIRLPGVRLVSAGRLDKDSEGAIIFSNDGEFINLLAHPRYGIRKRYIVETARPIAPAHLEKMTKGIYDDGELLKVISVTPIGVKRYEIVLNEGKKREIRRLTAAGNAPTVRLTRVAIGKIELGKLQCGKFRELSAAEVASLREKRPGK